MSYLISNLRLSSSYAKVQNSYGKVISSVGNEEIFIESEEKIEAPVLIAQKEEPKVVEEEKQLIATTNEPRYEQSIPVVATKNKTDAMKKEKIAIVLKNLSVREKPFMNGKIIGEVSKNEKVTVLDEDERIPGWYKTNKGYLASKYLKIKNIQE